MTELSVTHDHWTDDGYAWLEAMPRLGWLVVSSWGSLGWDMGEWPLVIVSVRHDGDGRPLAPKTKLHPAAWPRFQVAEYVEGDVTCWTYDEAVDVRDKLDSLAERWWRHPEGSGPPDIGSFPEGELPAAYRGPYRRGAQESAPDLSRMAPVVPIKKP